MSKLASLELIRTTDALSALAEKYRQDVRLRWPKINFDAEVWELNTLYGTRMLDLRFGPMISGFSGRDPSYVLAFRCLTARRAVAGKHKTNVAANKAWRLLENLKIPFGALRYKDLNDLESALVKQATPLSAGPLLSHLRLLSTMLDELARLNVIVSVAWSPSASNKAALQKLISKKTRDADCRTRIDLLDRQIEGFSDATKAMLHDDLRLTAVDRSAIAVANILMCAPSRINEPLCLSIFDRYTIQGYATRPVFDYSSKGYQTHQLLLMKGSKGAEWSGKPILNFMLDLSNRCWEILIELGQRSRNILRHYEQTPDRLYLPSGIEHLRGQLVSKASLWKICNLTSQEPTEKHIASITGSLWDKISQRRDPDGSKVILIDNPNTHKANGAKNSNYQIPVVPWEVVENRLIERVNQRMERMRWVTDETRYHGKLSEMLVLIDTERTPFLPQAWSGTLITQRLKDPPWRLKQNVERSVFRKLELKMTKNEKLVYCYIEPHDMRRWLTTKALDARERLSDVLINKWANRVDIHQLSAYDLRSSSQKTHQINLPVPQELESITAGLNALDGIQNEYGLDVDISVVHGDPLTITSVDAVISATESRPVARTGNQIIILYPNRFGVCLHQHHETPCRSYTGCSEGCNEQLTVKGHLPTNEEWRRQDEWNNRSIVNQLQALVTARNRGVADDQPKLDSHLLMLVQGVDVPTIAKELISRFHDIKDQIHDLSFRNNLEAAFIARGIVARLDDTLVPMGALIKYHNPAKHASPGYERAIEAQCGSREETASRQKLFHHRFPELAPKSLGLKDERHLLESDGEAERPDNEQTA